MASKSTISVTFKLNSDSKTFQDLVKSSDSLKEALNSASVEAEQLTKKLGKQAFSSATKDIASMAAGFVSLKAAFGVLKSALATVKEFERANAELASVLGTTLDGVTALTDQALLLGRTTEFTAKDVTALQNSLARLGFSQDQILNMSDSVLKFASAVNTDLGSAADFAGASLRSFGLRADQTQAMLDVLAASTTKSALSFEKLNASMSIVAPVAAALGFGVKDVSALLGALSNAGFDASSAATALRNMFLYLADSNSKLSRAMGGSVKDIDSLIDGLKDLQESGTDVATMLDLTDKRSVAAFATFVSGADSVKQLRAELDSANGSLEQMYSTVSDNLDGAIKSLESAWEGMMLTIRNSAGPLKDATNWLAGFLNFYTDIFSGKSGAEAMTNAKNTRFDHQVQEYIKGNTAKGITSKEDYANEYARLTGIINTDKTTVPLKERRELERQINAAYKERILLMGAEEKLFSQMAEQEDVNIVNVTATGVGKAPKGSGKATASKVDLTAVKEDIEVMKSLELEAAESEASVERATAALMNFYGVDPSALDPIIAQIERIGDTANGVIPELQGMLDQIQNGITDNLTKSLNTDSLSSTTEAISAMANVMSGLNGIVGESASSWLSWGANVVKSIAAAIPAIVQLTAAQGAEATANTVSATTGAASSVANVPIVGPALAITAMATVLAAILSSISSIPKFAEGGIAFGPTLGLFGEYSGASNNPEVVAPLDKLRGMLNDGGTGTPKVVELRAKGRDLYGIINLESDIRRRS